jgi:hypothetical protein
MSGFRLLRRKSDICARRAGFRDGALSLSGYRSSARQERAAIMSVVANYTFDDSSRDGAATNTAPGGAPDAGYRGDAFAAGGAAHFDGKGDYLEIPANAAFALSQGTVTMSFTQATAASGNNPSDTPGAHTLISIDSMGYDGGGHLTIYIRSDGALEVRHQTASSDHYFRGGRIAAGEPATFSYSWGENGSVLVLNGATVARGRVPLTVAGDVEPIVIGAAQTRSGDGVADRLSGYFEGSISRVQITDQPSAGGGFVPCLAGGSRILTDDGDRPIETLRPGDLVQTLDRGLRPVRWIGRSNVSSEALARFETLRPVAIAPQALGNVAPLLLSRQHAVLLPHGAAGLLVRAAHLAKYGGDAFVIREDPTPITYWHLLFDRHEVIFAEGAPVESLLPGPAARASMPGLAAHLARLSPSGRALLERPVRPLADGSTARACIARLASAREPAALV